MPQHFNRWNQICIISHNHGSILAIIISFVKKMYGNINIGLFFLTLHYELTAVIAEPVFFFEVSHDDLNPSAF